MKPFPLACLLGLLSLLLGGCRSLLGIDHPPLRIYDLQPAIPPDSRAKPLDASRAASISLSIDRPTTASRLLDSPRIVVRPVPTELQIYSDAAWSQPATSLLQETLRRHLEMTTPLVVISSNHSSLRPDYRLHLHLRRFEADYQHSALPVTTIEVSALLIETAHQRAWRCALITITEPATATDINSVVNSFEIALGNTTAAIQDCVLPHIETENPSPNPFQGLPPVP